MPPLKKIEYERFCVHYAKTANGAESYRQAGYKPKTNESAAANARRLLMRPEIVARLCEIAVESASKEIADITEIHKKLTAIIRGEIKEDVVVVESTGTGKSKARIVQTNPNPNTIIKAAVELAKMQGAYLAKKTAIDLEEQQAKIDKLKAEIARIKGEDDGADMQDDGFLEALRAEAQEIWQED